MIKFNWIMTNTQNKNQNKICWSCEIHLVYLFDFQEDQGTYMALVKDMIADKSKRLIVNINDLRKKNPARANDLLTNAFDEQLAFSRALKEYVSTLQPSFAKTYEDFFVGFEGSFGSRHVTPRTLNSRWGSWAIQSHYFHFRNMIWNLNWQYQNWLNDIM